MAVILKIKKIVINRDISKNYLADFNEILLDDA